MAPLVVCVCVGFCSTTQARSRLSRHRKTDLTTSRERRSEEPRSFTTTYYFLGDTINAFLSQPITEVGSHLRFDLGVTPFSRFYILSTGVRPSSFMPLASTCLALSYRPMSATFFSGLSAYMTLMVFAFLLLVSLAS